MLGLLLNRWVIGAVVAVLLLGGTYWKGYSTGKHVVEAKWAIERAEQAKKYAEAVAQARRTEQAAQEAANRYQREKKDAIDRLQRSHRAIVDGLRNRPARTAAAVPDATGNAQGQRGASGAELSREDSEFLVGEAARADQLREELEACYRQYDAARKVINR